MRSTRQFTPRKRRRLSNGAARFFRAIDRVLDDAPGWGDGPEQRAIDRGLLILMAALVSALILSQLAIYYHVSVSWFGA